jgi:beta-glucosidase/6-phospho-beta-glucosidase/beta-galactosidase
MTATFDSFFQAGFECSSHRRPDGIRLDLIESTAHDRNMVQDYRLCARLGFRTIRDGLRWHLIEQSPGRYDWSTWLPALEAAEQVGLQVIWDLFHYGCPDHIDLGAADFPERFANFAVAAVEVQQSVSARAPLVCPLNEISFICWAVKEGYVPPAGPRRKGWLKRQLVRAAVASAGAIRDRWPDSTIVWAEPLIHIAPHSHDEEEVSAAAEANDEQFQAYDWITGRAEPELGGREDFVDLIGLNFYPHNQWYLDGPTIPMGHHEYRPLADMLEEVARRYSKPLLISETGAEGSGRAPWLHYVCQEVLEAQSRGARVEGLCLYPITDYPGWENGRHCEVGLLSRPGADGRREVYGALYEELQRQRAVFGLEEKTSTSRIRVAIGA